MFHFSFFDSFLKKSNIIGCISFCNIGFIATSVVYDNFGFNYGCWLSSHVFGYGNFVSIFISYILFCNNKLIVSIKIQSVVASLILKHSGENTADNFDLICGVVYFGLYLTTVISVVVSLLFYNNIII